MSILIYVLAGVGALVLLMFIALAVILSCIVANEKREEALRAIIVQEIAKEKKFQIDGLELKIAAVKMLHDRLDSLAKRESDLWKNNGERLIQIDQRIENAISLCMAEINDVKQDIAVLKVEPV